MTEAASWRKCSSCRQPLAFGATYYRCSVSTCNRARMELTFCSIPCWEAHLPEMRHREAWAEEARAPAASEDRGSDEREASQRPEASRTRGTADRTASIALANEDVPKDVLVVVSKLKKYIKARSGMNTSEGVVGVLSEKIREACDVAIRRAGQADRRTVMARDFEDP